MYGVCMGVFLSHLSILFENKVLSLELTYWLDWLPASPAGLPSPPGALGLQECTPMANILHVCPGPKRGTLRSPQQALP